MKIYTKTGDDGSTGLLGGTRVPKDHLRVTACGEVDELNALLGVVKALAEAEENGRADRVAHGGERPRRGAERKGRGKALSALLAAIQSDLFALGAQLADPAARVASRKAKARLGAAHTRRLEKAIDAAEAGLPALTSFILPGGTPLGAQLHLARAVCRRAERAAVTLHRDTPLDPWLLRYLNRLSDLLFVLARAANQSAGRSEDRW
jgi:cob(I)alamin adenosyltransferase